MTRAAYQVGTPPARDVRRARERRDYEDRIRELEAVLRKARSILVRMGVDGVPTSEINETIERIGALTKKRP